MSDEGKIHYNLGNAILRNRKARWIILHQAKYITNKLHEFHILNFNPLNTPIQLGIFLSNEDHINFHDYPYF
uniref:Reverse transcriptase Ty1/copia-type domain-containing protein n=1 Tax=Physcomitrium patens TaxID=3218 RepID=A0A2K1IYS6_PHYPA|nr:hypothetical protein PHYPA_024246 [Physcomitrium patens]